MVEVSLWGRVEDGKLVFKRPVPLPDGTEVRVSIFPVESPWPEPTPEEIEALKSEPWFGLWADREDMADSVAWQRRMRGHCDCCRKQSE